MQDNNTNPEGKSLSELIKTEQRKIILVCEEEALIKHLDLITKMAMHEEILLIHVTDLPVTDQVQIENLMSKERDFSSIEEIRERQIPIRKLEISDLVCEVHEMKDLVEDEKARAKSGPNPKNMPLPKQVLRKPIKSFNHRRT